jgi:hypothetical protein
MNEHFIYNISIFILFVKYFKKRNTLPRTSRERVLFEAKRCRCNLRRSQRESRSKSHYSKSLRGVGGNWPSFKGQAVRRRTWLLDLNGADETACRADAGGAAVCGRAQAGGEGWDVFGANFAVLVASKHGLLFFLSNCVFV